MQPDLNYLITDLKTKYDLFSHHLIWTFRLNSQNYRGPYLLCRSTKRVLYFLESAYSKIQNSKERSIEFKLKNPNLSGNLHLGEQGYKYEIEAFIVFVEALISKKSANLFFLGMDETSQKGMIDKFEIVFNSIDLIINKMRNDIIHLNNEFYDLYNLPSTFSLETEQVQINPLSSREGIDGNLILDFNKVSEAILPLLDEAVIIWMKFLIQNIGGETDRFNEITRTPYRAVGCYLAQEGFKINIHIPPYKDDINIRKCTFIKRIFSYIGSRFKN